MNNRSVHPPSKQHVAHRPLVVWAVAMVLVVSGCGGGTDDSDGASKSLRSSARSLQQAMDASSQAIDDVRGTRDALERAATALGPQIAQTNDVIAVLTPEADGEDPAPALLEAARQQRSFLQFSIDATRSRSRRAANSALARARTAGRRATSAYADVAQQSGELAGLLPASTTFNSGRLRDAVQQANRPRRSTPSPSEGARNDGSRSNEEPDSTPSTSDDWPGGAAYTTVLASVQSESEARRIQSQASASGLDAGVLRSSNYRSLRPGYWVVFSGSSSSKQDADRRTARAKSLGYGDAYSRFVSG